jgi:hypothetical protein
MGGEICAADVGGTSKDLAQQFAKGHYQLLA